MGRTWVVLGLVVALLAGPAARAADEGARPQTAAERFEKLSPEQKEALRQKLREFKALPPEEKERVRANLERFRQMPPEERERVRALVDEVFTPPERDTMQVATHEIDELLLLSSWFRRFPAELERTEPASAYLGEPRRTRRRARSA